MISPAQLRAARGLLKLSAKELAAIAKVSAVAISKFEGERVKQIHSTNAALERALTAKGIEFITNVDGEGVFLRKERK